MAKSARIMEILLDIMDTMITISFNPMIQSLFLIHKHAHHYNSISNDGMNRYFSNKYQISFYIYTSSFSSFFPYPFFFYLIL